MGTATAGGPDRATQAADAAVACPLLEGIDPSGARGVLVLIGARHARLHASRTGVSLNLLYALIGAVEYRDWRDVARQDRLAILLSLEERGLTQGEWQSPPSLADSVRPVDDLGLVT